MNTLPSDLYDAVTVSEIDALAIESGIPGYTLMRRAGLAIFDCLTGSYPDAESLLVVCGAGNNAGDGYVLARLARQNGMDVTLASLTDHTQLKGDAAQACRDWLAVGDVVPFSEEFLSVDVIIDALLGIGLDRDVEGQWSDCIEAINAFPAPVISVDIPSGLDADTGRIRGVAIEAEHTVSFIVLKQGMFTAYGKQYCGEVSYADLDVPSELLRSKITDKHLIQIVDVALESRTHNSHKSRYGCVLIIGGNRGMAGAAALAAKSALTAGAGLVRVLTRPEHVSIVTSICPEAMVLGSENGDVPEGLADSVTHILIGCGLGTDAWAQRLLHQVKSSRLPVIYDADALNLIAEEDIDIMNAVVITPHPGEAGRLLTTGTHAVQRNRFHAASKLAKMFKTTAVLKGSGTLVADSDEHWVCTAGGPAMASAGMGDVLAGIIAALLAQRLDPLQAAKTGVWWHSTAADIAADGLTRGVLASDVIDHLSLACPEE